MPEIQKIEVRKSRPGEKRFYSKCRRGECGLWNTVDGPYPDEAMAAQVARQVRDQEKWDRAAVFEGRRMKAEV